MEEINSCLMLAVNLDTPVDLGSIFDSEDYKDTGIELDSHVTLLYAQDKEIPKNNIISDIKIILDYEYDKFIRLCSEVENSRPVLDLFELSSFSNDSDYVILKLRKDCKEYEYFRLINKGLRTKYDVSSNFPDYTAHITLAELEKGKAEKYLNSNKLNRVLDDTYFNFEDLMISYGPSNTPVDRRQYFLTQFSCVDRYFRLATLKKNNDELK